MGAFGPMDRRRRTDGQMDVPTDGEHHNIIHPSYDGCIKRERMMLFTGAALTPIAAPHKKPRAHSWLLSCDSEEAIGQMLVP